MRDDIEERMEAQEAEYEMSIDDDRKAESEILEEHLCRGCGRELSADNCWMVDGCPCNSTKGCNDGNQVISDWRNELRATEQGLRIASEARVKELTAELVAERPKVIVCDGVQESGHLYAWRKGFDWGAFIGDATMFFIDGYEYLDFGIPQFADRPTNEGG